MDLDTLTGLKYRQIQKIAKERRLKANLPKDALIKAILKYETEEKDQSQSDINNVETTISSQSSCTDTDHDLDSDSENKKLNETYEVQDSSVLTNDEEIEPNVSKKKSVSQFNTPTLLNASDRFEQFFALDDEHIPVLSSGSPPKQYKQQTKSKLLATASPSTFTKATVSKIKKGSTPSNTPQQKRDVLPDVFTRLSSVSKRRSSVACTPKAGLKRPSAIQSALKGNFSTRTSFNGAVGSIQKRKGIMQSSRKSTTGNRLTNTTSKKVRLMAKENDPSLAAQRSNIPKMVKRKMPNFAKLHEREFNKTDTLDNYLSKKEKRANALTPGPKSAKKLPPAIVNIKTKPIMAPLVGISTKVPARRSPRNVQTQIIKTDTKIKGFVPTNLTVAEKNFKFSSQKTTNPKTNQRNDVNSQTKPFKFSAKAENITMKQENKILSNITNSSSYKNNSPSKIGLDLKQGAAKPLSYKPYTGKLGAWNPKKTLEERKALANKMAPKAKKLDIIKGVRMNKRAELMMQKRGIVE